MSSEWKKDEKGRWSYSVAYTAEKRSRRVTVFERKPGGLFWIRAWDPSARGGKGMVRFRSLEHRERKRAERQALADTAKLADGGTGVRPEESVTFSRLFALYETHRTPQKGAKEQEDDLRRFEMWTRVLGARTDPHRITRNGWEGFVRDRLSGAIDARGNQVEEKDRRPVGPRAVERDVRFLLAVLRWGTTWGDEKGYLLRENVARGYTIPRERNPRRPVATWDRYAALRAKTDEVTMEMGRKEGESVRERSHLSELLDLAVATGRRISAICQLRYQDLHLSDGTPYGSIRWPANTDKEGRESTVPLNPLGRAAIDRVLGERPGIGDVPLFPSPKDRSKPVSRHLADKWLREVEELAGLETQDGSLWHAFRRMWATARKGLAVQDVARVGGWSTTQVLQDMYQQADVETSLEVVLHEGRVRGASR